MSLAGSDPVNNDDNANYWPNALYITGLTASMAVNTLVTGMIVFRIFKVTGDRPSITSFERTLGSVATEGTKFRKIMFIVIESGMALFIIQLIRTLLAFIPVSVEQEPFITPAIDFVIVINAMLNVIIIIYLLLLFC